MTAALEPFDICGELPRGTTLLEASAGTGKTWTIAALVTRYVADGVARLDEMLVVTFGRAASQELRERVREQLVKAEHALAHHLAGGHGPARDPDRGTPGGRPEGAQPGNTLIDLLLEGSRDQVELRHRRLRTALGSFDAATIATIHQFCQLVLRSLGVAGDTDTNATLVEDLDDLLAEVVDDLYLRAFAARDEDPPFSRAAALALGRAASSDPQARLEPSAAPDTDPGSGAAQRVRFAHAVREEMEVRKRRLGILSYDDLLSQLADALRQPDAPARARMRGRWKVALVDEFQDTDPVQWQVFERAFEGVATMVLIGDPKQAIYQFRGGDVFTYLDAARTAGTRQTLGVNWRSDSDLLDRVQALLRGAELGDEQIVVHDVEAHHSGSRLSGASSPFRLRVLGPAELGISGRRTPTVAKVREHLYEDVARDIKRLLVSGARFDDRDLRPRDVAVIAYRHADLLAIQAALARHGVPSVVAGGGSVFATAAATEWLCLLEALEQPHRSPRVRAAALTAFLGLTAAELDAGGDEITDALSDRIRGWVELLTGRGVAAVVEAATSDGMTERVLGRVGGERFLTDLRHVGEALHKVAVTERLGPVALAGWLRLQMADDKVEVAGERTRRLDSDAAAVQLVTIHASKGLQYPVVYLPTLWDRFERDPDVLLFHAPDDDPEPRRRCRNVGAGGPGWGDQLARHVAEDRAEWLRLLYVAVTRAQSQVVTWYAATPRNTPCSPLHRLLLGRAPTSSQVPDTHPLEAPEALRDKLDWHAAHGGPVWEPAAWAELTEQQLPVDDTVLTVRDFDRVVDTRWRRTSYSALSAATTPSPAGQAGPALSEPEAPPREDEPDAPVEVPGAGQAEESVPSPMAGLPVGATFGSLVHAVLEHADLQAGDLRAELLEHIREQLVWWPAPVEADELADALVAVCDSPLGPLAGGRTLRDIPKRDRLAELDFELPLGGGDDRDYAAEEVVLGDLGPLLRRHLPDDDPLRRYAGTLADEELAGQALLGYLTGSVDLVMRVEVDGTTRYLTVDYKTNWLGDRDHPLTAHSYRPEVLDEAMGHSDYPLQALLYTVVQHRFLRWRLPDYDPGQHLGGVLYLYLRGMCGPGTPVVDGMPCGVFSWRAPVELVLELSDLLDGMVRR